MRIEQTARPAQESTIVGPKIAADKPAEKIAELAIQQVSSAGGLLRALFKYPTDPNAALR
jgi:hypothetical protein